MIVTTRFPDLAPRPETSANAAFRRAFAARWGRENTVFLASARQFESAPLRSALSVKVMERGTTHLVLGRRQLLFEAGQCLVVNEGETYAARIASAEPVHSFSLHFRPGLAAEVAAARRGGWRRALDQPGDAAAATTAPLLRDDLHLPSAALRQLLADVRALVLQGERDGEAYEPLFIAVLDRVMRDHEVDRHQAGAALHVVRPTTRDELRRRAGWAHDFILSNYAEPLLLDDIAAAAHLSKYHLLRVFHQVYGRTPLAALRARRAEAAQALLRHGERDLAAVAAGVGFGSRWAMQRALRERFGVTGRTLRAGPDHDPAVVDR